MNNPTQRRPSLLQHAAFVTPEELARQLYFHGSIEPWRHDMPEPGAYDGLFWTANTPQLAQTYIPDWGGKTLIGFPTWAGNDPIIPSRHGVAWALAQQFGARAEVLEWQRDDSRPQSWRVGKPVTHTELMQHLQAFGYTFENGDTWVKTVTHSDVPHNPAYTEGTFRCEAVHADARPFGRLILIDPTVLQTELRGLDIAGDREGDLTERQYHNLDDFDAARAAGYDFVKINDFTQSPAWGNVGHHSWGFFGQVMQRLHAAGGVVAIAATHRDFSSFEPQEALTPEFLDWHFSRVIQALAHDQDVPDDVLLAHQARFEEILSEVLHQDNQDNAGDAPVLGIGTLSARPLPLTPDTVRDLRQQLQPQIDAWTYGLHRGHFDQGKLSFTLGQALSLDHAALSFALEDTGLVVPVRTHFQTQSGRFFTQGEALDAYSAARARWRCAQRHSPLERAA